MPASSSWQKTPRPTEQLQTLFATGTESDAGVDFVYRMGANPLRLRSSLFHIQTPDTFRVSSTSTVLLLSTVFARLTTFENP